MKKRGILLIIVVLMLIFSVLVISQTVLKTQPIDYSSNSVGEIVTLNESKDNYNVQTKKEIIGFQPYNSEETYTIYHANLTFNNGSTIIYKDEKPVSEIILNLKSKQEWETTETRLVVDKNKKGNPIYSSGEEIGIIYGEKTYNFDEKGCWVCGDYIACLDKKDGWSDQRAEKYKCDVFNYPIIRSGESGWIKHLDSKIKTFDSTNGELK